MTDELTHPLPSDPIGYTPALEKTPDLRSVSILPPKSKLDDATKQSVRWMFNESKFIPLALVCGMAEVDISDTREEAQSGLDHFLKDMQERRNIEPGSVLSAVVPATVAEALAYLGAAGVVVSDALAGRLRQIVRHQLGVETKVEHCTRWMLLDVTRAMLTLQDQRDSAKVLKYAWTIFRQRHGHSGVSRK
jgi:hypothetical protein